MRNFATLSRTMYVTRKGHNMSRRQALPIAKLFCIGFESAPEFAGYIADYFEGFGGADDVCTTIFTPSEFEALRSFKVWYMNGYEPHMPARIRARAHKAVSYMYVNLNTGFSLVFLER